MVGITQYHTKAHIALAMLEAVCFQTREVLDAMKADSGVELGMYRYLAMLPWLSHLS